MKFIDEKIEQYCIEKSTIPSRDCQKIQDYTLQNEHWSQMLTGKMEGSVLGFLIRLVKAKRVLEFGTYTGYSALAMAEQLPEDGEVFTLDKDKRVHEVAQGFWDQSPHGNKIHPRLGEAIDVLNELPGNFDFVFIDADKVNYKKYFDFSLSRLSDGGMIAIDNVLWSGKVITDDQTESTVAIKELNDHLSKRDDLFVTLLPIRDGVFLVQKK